MFEQLVQYDFKSTKTRTALILNFMFVSCVSSQLITTVAGNGVLGTGGDWIPATTSSFKNPRGVATDASGNIFIAESGNHRIRKVFVNGSIATIAGTGAAGFGGDGALQNFLH